MSTEWRDESVYDAIVAGSAAPTSPGWYTREQQRALRSAGVPMEAFYIRGRLEWFFLYPALQALAARRDTPALREMPPFDYLLAWAEGRLG